MIPSQVFAGLLVAYLVFTAMTGQTIASNRSAHQRRADGSGVCVRRGVVLQNAPKKTRIWLTELGHAAHVGICVVGALAGALVFLALARFFYGLHPF